MKVNYLLCHVNPFTHNITPFAIIKMPIQTHVDLKSEKDAITFFYKFANLLHEKYPEVFPSYHDEHKRKRLFWYNLYCDVQKRVLIRLRDQVRKEIEEHYRSKRALVQAIRERIDKILASLPVYEL
jgi:hypothetical protein